MKGRLHVLREEMEDPPVPWLPIPVIETTPSPRIGFPNERKGTRMAKTDPGIDAFFANAKQWCDEMQALREIMRSCPLTEELKWRQPCYTHGGGNVVIVSGYSKGATVSFLKGVLLKDPEGVLEAPGENSRSARMIRFQTVGEIAACRDILRAYVLEAIEIEKSGQKVEFAKDDLDYPSELSEILASDPEFRVAFEGLTPGRRRGYVLHFAQPKQSKTHVSRIGKARPRILEGKGMHDR